MNKKTIVLGFLMCFMCLFLAGGQKVYAKSAKAIYREMGKNFYQHKKEFNIKTDYNSTVKKILAAATSNNDAKYYEILFLAGENFDRKSDISDGDYMWGNISDLVCYYSSGELRFEDVTYFESRNQERIVAKKTTAIAKKIMRSTKSKYERIVKTYQYLAKHIKYDERKNCYFSAWGGLVKGKTVCNGYALLMYRILMKMGIPCRFVTGKVKDGKRWYSHAWNICKIKGKWYYVDACSDDAGRYAAGDFFLKGERTIKKTHKLDYFYKTTTFNKKHPMSSKNY